MRTACRFAIDEEDPTWLDTTRAPLGAALFNFLHRGVLLGVRRRWLLDRARCVEWREHEPALRDSFGRTVLDEVYRAHVDRYGRRDSAGLCLARKLGFRRVRTRRAVRPRDCEDASFLYNKTNESRRG